MKKKLIFLAFLLFFCGINKTNAALMKHHLGMTMLVDGQKEEVIFYEDLDTGMPVFRLSYEDDEKLEFNYNEVSSISLTSAEEEKIKVILSAIIEGKKYIEMDWLHVVGAQTLIWEVLQDRFTKSYSYSFATPFLEEYRELVRKKEEELKKKQIYKYEGVANSPLTINFLPNFSHPYEIKPVNQDIDVKKEGNEFVLALKNAGTYEFQVESEYFEEEVKYFSNGKMDIIELVKPKKVSPTIEVVVNEPKKQAHDVVFLSTEGIEVSLNKTSYFSGDDVSFTYKLEEGYVLNGIHAKKKDGTEIEIQHNTFVMPEEDVFLKFDVASIPSYQIGKNISKGVTLSTLEKAKKGTVVLLNYKVDANYELKTVRVTTLSGKEIPLNNNSFLMPEENVLVTILAQEIKPFGITVLEAKGIYIDVARAAFGGEVVSLNYHLDENYKLTSLHVKTIDGKELPIQNNSFLMPNAPVYVEAVMAEKKESYEIEVTSLGVMARIPNKALEGEIVTLDYELVPDYILEEVVVKTESGSQVVVENQTFSMPAEKVWIEFITKQKEKEYSIINPTTKIKVQTTAKSGETVPFSYPNEEGVEVKVYTLKGIEVPLHNHSFVMPSTSVYFTITKQKIDHDLIVFENPDITLDLPTTARTGEWVQVEYSLKEGYDLEKMFFFTKSKKEIPVKNGTFQMPEEDVFVIAKTHPKNSSVTYKVPNTKKNEFFYPYLLLPFLLLFRKKDRPKKV